MDVICTTCGRDNPNHLLYCEECGTRLIARRATPTPPQGVRSLDEGFTDASPSRGGAAQRPPAPDIQFSRRETIPMDDRIVCPLCGSRNPRSVRFCVTCGHLLEQGQPERDRPREAEREMQAKGEPAQPPPLDRETPLAGQPIERRPLVDPQGRPSVDPQGRPLVDPQRRPSVDPQGRLLGDPQPAPPIAPHRVVQLDEHPTAEASDMRRCPRCQGLSAATAQFCRFCGGPLPGASSARSPSVTPRPASVALSATQALSGPQGHMPSGSTVATSLANAAGSMATSSGALAPKAPGSETASPDAGVSGASANWGATVAMKTRPAGGGRARLVLIARDGGEGPSYPVGDGADVGRTEGAIVVADDPYVSPRHARIALRGGAHYLRDLASINGVFVRIPFGPDAAAEGPNGDGAGPRPIGNSEQTLGDQELFLVGQQVLRFEVVKHAEEGFGVASENGTLLFGTPAAPRYARLTQRTVEGVSRDVYHVRKAETVIGRESGDLVFTDDPFLSRRHAILRVEGATGSGRRRITLSDLGSSNGTFLQIRDEVQLKSGDHFRIGQQLFRFDEGRGRGGA